MKICVVRGDIVREDVEAIVIAANIPLRGGGGVDAAVHAAAGPELLLACRALAPCPAGSAVVPRPSSWHLCSGSSTLSGRDTAVPKTQPP